MADALMGVVMQKRLYVPIRKKNYLLVDAWTCLGSLVGVFPRTVWSRPVENGWEARVEAVTKDGQVVGAAEAECLRSETRWTNADDYAVRSMAQTRAMGKALRMPLGFIAVLAGFEATPAEEMPAADDSRADARAAEEPPPRPLRHLPPPSRPRSRIRAGTSSRSRRTRGNPWLRCTGQTPGSSRRSRRQRRPRRTVRARLPRRDARPRERPGAADLMRVGDWVTTPYGLGRVIGFPRQRSFVFGRARSEAFVRVVLMDGTRRDVPARELLGREAV